MPLDFEMMVFYEDLAMHAGLKVARYEAGKFKFAVPGKFPEDFTG
jgi:hypothetical protein